MSGLQSFNVTFLYRLSSLGTSTEVIPKKHQVPGTIYSGKPKKDGAEQVESSRAELYYAVETQHKTHIWISLGHCLMWPWHLQLL